MGEKHQILDSVIELTAQRDSELLEKTLIKTISELFKAVETLFIRVGSDSKLKRRVLRVKDQMLECLETGDSIQKACFEYESLLEKADQSHTMISESDNHYSRRVYPVIYRGSLFGFIVIRTAFDMDEDSRLMEGFLKIYQNYLNLLIDNQLDKLTGLLNRKTFDDKILQVMNILKNTQTKICGPDNRRKPGRNGWDFWLGIFDVDNFKAINDQFGHIYGDDVLILFARLMLKTFREEDILFRFGGEEFVAVIQAENSQEALSVFDRFRKAVEVYDFGLAGKVTVSVGMVQMNADDELPSIVGHADQALYYAKNAGKNRVCIYEELVSAGEIKTQTAHGDIVLFDDKMTIF